MLQHMLTTVDNPYDPFDQFNEWFDWDLANGYHTPSLLARLVKSSDEISEADQASAVEQAIDDIVKINGAGNYRKVSKEIETT
jgi:hypothetical protein